MKHIIYFYMFCTLIFVLASCNKDCNGLTSECEVKCNQVPEVGPCNAAIPKYYFNTRTKKCEMFIWGGCNGLVPFDTLDECTLCGCK